MKLENIGFYTLCDERVGQLTETSPMWRCEMILTSACNFKCPYCRGENGSLKGHVPLETVKKGLSLWIGDGLKNVRLSGGEPTLYPHLVDLVKMAKDGGVERIAISTNGSADWAIYEELLDAGVNDFSISLDACCSSFAEQMSGGKCNFDKLKSNIVELSKRTYVSVGVVLNDANLSETKDVIEFAHNMGVADIKVIPAAQYGTGLDVDIHQEILDAHPILKYRMGNFASGRPIRGVGDNDSSRCYLVMDDSTISGEYHYPCVIYMREGGDPIGKVGHDMRKERIEWSRKHDSSKDPICSSNCLDVCIDHNNKCRSHVNDQEI